MKGGNMSNRDPFNQKRFNALGALGFLEGFFYGDTKALAKLKVIGAYLLHEDEELCGTCKKWRADKESKFLILEGMECIHCDTLRGDQNEEPEL